MKKNFINILITVFIGLVLYYFMLPPINITSLLFWVYIIILLSVYFVISCFSFIEAKIINRRQFNLVNKFDKSLIVLYSIFTIIALIIIINIICSPLFNSKSYANRLNVDDTKKFEEDVPLADFKAIPLLDKESSQKLGDRTMGTMPDLVSQFYVSDLYTQINYQDEIIRVTPLEYADTIKYFTNRQEGIKGYITVNSVNGESKLVKLDEGMRYMPSAMFLENLDRKLRFTYPTKILGTKSFEIDNEGNPYWIVQTLSYTGINLKEEVNGVIILDPITGDSKWYKVEEVPNWVDHVYDANLIIEQFNNYGEYKNGFFNSLFGQKGVVNTTAGYNYLAMHDDIYLYTGVTSVIADESNLGFILTNMRTKETHYYNIPGAEEFSAMASSEGAEQDKKYKATFPLLINLNNKPTYLMSLKDNAGLVKMYALVDVSNYQKVVTSDASLGIEEAVRRYLNENTTIDSSNEINKSIQIIEINTAVIDGITYYYIVDSENNHYTTSIKTNKNILPFLKVGDTININYYEQLDIKVITKINK